MEREVFVSGGGTIRAIPIAAMLHERRISLECAGALCTSGGHVFCACGEDIFRLDAQTLLPQTILCGGPGMSNLLVSADGTRLYALCSDADSVLMIDLLHGEPALLQHAGVNPRRIRREGGRLTIAGGESGEVIVLCERTLRLLDRIMMPGPVYDAALHTGRVVALCLTASLNSMLVIVGCGGARSTLALSGMPGCLLMRRGCILAATERTLYSVSADGARILDARAAPGRASWMEEADGRLLLLDAYGEGLYSLENAGWRLLCREAAFAAVGGA